MELGNDSSRKIWPQVSPLSVAVKWWLSGIIFFIDRSRSWGSSGSSVNLCGFSKVATSGQPFSSGPKGMTSNRDPGGISGTLSNFRSHTAPLMHYLIFKFFFLQFIYLLFGYTGSSLLYMGFLFAASRGASHCYGARAVGV